MWIIVKYYYGEYTVTLMHLLTIWLVAHSFQCNPTMKLSNVNGMCVSSWRFATSLGPWVNVQSYQCGSLTVWGWCEALVTIWKSLWGGDGSFYWLSVRADGRRSLSGKRETRHQLLTIYIGTCNRIMTQLTGWPVGENQEKYIDGLDANDIQTDTAT